MEDNSQYAGEIITYTVVDSNIVHNCMYHCSNNLRIALIGNREELQQAYVCTVCGDYHWEPVKRVVVDTDNVQKLVDKI